LALATAALSLLIAILAGAFGSVLGIGGGLFIIPSLTLLLGIKLKVAIAASIVAVVATSLSGGSVYLRRQTADLRLGLLMALATTPGAIAGAYLATSVNARWLAALFTIVLGASAFQMWRGGGNVDPTDDESAEDVAEQKQIAFSSEYVDPGSGCVVQYNVLRLPLGIGASLLAGLLSGLLGVGGGVVQVPVMHTIMKVPIKVASATSTFVIGITASAGAFVYYNHRPSFVDPLLAAPVVIGVVAGASLGSRVLGRISQRGLRLMFIGLLVIYTIDMGLRASGVVTR
jgi:uncharacterized protein